MNIRTLRQRTKWMALVAMPVLACSRVAPGTAYAKARSERTGAAVQATMSTKAAPAAALRLVLAPTGNAARYRVRERLVGHDFPNDAVGETKSLSGAISFDSKGKVIREASKFTVDASTFVSDQNRRDGFVRGRLLEADDYPMITLVPTDVRGVSLPLPTTGSSPTGIRSEMRVPRPPQRITVGTECAGPQRGTSGVVTTGPSHRHRGERGGGRYGLRRRW